jgi:alpha-1,3-mannosyltransferase
MPFLLWRTGWHPIILISIWLVEEWAWNVYPSTSASSIAVVGVYAIVLAGVWINSGEEVESGVATEWATEEHDTPAYEPIASKVSEKTGS